MNENHVVDADELVDLVGYSAAVIPPQADTVTHMTADGAEPWQKAASIIHSDVTIRTPTSQREETVSVINFLAPTNLTPEGIWAVQPQSVTLPCGNMNITGPISIVTRVKPCRRLKQNGGWQRTFLVGYDYNHDRDTGVLSILRRRVVRTGRMSAVPWGGVPIR